VIFSNFKYGFFAFYDPPLTKADFITKTPLLNGYKGLTGQAKSRTLSASAFAARAPREHEIYFFSRFSRRGT
jgi:hypothetical protein